MTQYSNEIDSIIGRPKGERLEYNAILPTSKRLAELICSFANSKGGHIVLGVSDSMEINGLSNDFNADLITQKAVSQLLPQPSTFSKYVLFKDKKLYIIEVEKSEVTIRLEGNKYIRVEERTELSNAIELNFNADGYIYEKRGSNVNVTKQGVISYHSYDIDLKASYVELEKQTKNLSQSRTGIPQNEYLSRIKNGIESYCSYYELGSLENNSPIILKYPAYNYHAHLAFQLMTFDINKISAMLDFQHEHYTGINEFQKIVEHGVYNWINQNSPFDNELRLQKIMDWVERKRGVSYKKNKVARNIGDKILSEFGKKNAKDGQILMLTVVQNINNILNTEERKEFNNVFNGMVSDGFIGYDQGEPNFIRLGDKGYKWIQESTDNSELAPDVDSIESLPVVVILTALREEYAAVRSHLESINVIQKGSIPYEQGILKYDKRNIAKVIIKECGPRNPSTAQETQRAITNFKPKCIFFVGIAGSRKPNDFGLGDVIFAENVHYYEGGKSELSSFKSRPDDVKPTFTLTSIARIEQHKQDWKVLIKEDSYKDVNAGVGVIASGEKVVEHYDSAIGKILQENYSDSACVAMEEYGFLSAAQRQGVEFATVMAGVVRGISDILEMDGEGVTLENKTDRRPSYAKKLASNTAAAFAYWLIIKALSGQE